jgi:hypothetical protein
LQTGFDLIDGHQTHSDGKDYYAGDLALSFDGDAKYEYGVDFGLLTKNYDQDHGSGSTYNPTYVDTGSDTGIAGIDTAGVYDSVTWDNGVYQGHTISNPFALDEGTLLSAGFSQSAGSEATSYYLIVTFDLASLGLSGPLQLDAHWTMSCGNDYINGSTSLNSVPEPTSLGLIGRGLMGRRAVRRRRRRA